MPTIGIKGEELDLLIRQGATFGPFTVRLRNPDGTPVNLNDCTIRGQVRKTFDAVAVAASFDTEITNPEMGEFRFSISPFATQQIMAGESESAASSLYVYDLELVDAEGGVTPLTYGNARVFREVTR